MCAGQGPLGTCAGLATSDGPQLTLFVQPLAHTWQHEAEAKVLHGNAVHQHRRPAGAPAGAACLTN